MTPNGTPMTDPPPDPTPAYVEPPHDPRAPKPLTFAAPSHGHEYYGRAEADPVLAAYARRLEREVCELRAELALARAAKVTP